MEAFSEIFRKGDPIPVGYRNGGLLTGLRIDGRDPETGVLGEGIEAQLANAYANLERAVIAGGGSLDNVAQVSFFLADFEHRSLINGPWTEMFSDPDDRPTYKFMAAPLGVGELVQLEFLAVLGERREDIHLAGVAHLNPIPLAVRIGRHLFSSRVLPYDPATGAAPPEVAAQAHFCLENAGKVLRAAGMGWPDVTQGRAFLADLSDAPLIVEPWNAKFPDAAARPPLHQVRYGAGSLLAMLEFVAISAAAA